MEELVGSGAFLPEPGTLATVSWASETFSPIIAMNEIVPPSANA